MPTTWLQRLTRRYGLSMRLVLASLAGSVAVALFVSTLQVYLLYQQGVAGAQQRLDEIASSYLPSLESSLWEVNAASTARLLDGIARLPDVGAVILTDELAHTQRQAHAAPGNQVGAREFALLYREGRDSFPLGRLRVELSDDAIVAALKQRALGITITFVVSLLCAAVLFLVLFQRWVARHLRDMAAFVREADLATGPVQLRLDRATGALPDELDYVVAAINSMRESLRRDLLAISSGAEQVRRHRDSLEELVQQRTETLSEQNRLLVSVRDQLTTAAHVANLGIWSWDIAPDTLHWNSRNYAIFGLAEAESAGTLDYQLWSGQVLPEDLPRVRTAFARARDQGLPIDVVFRVAAPDGCIRHVHAAAHVESDAHGQPQRVTGICLDISDQRELEARLRAAKEQAELASRTKSEFVANMSHEIRTPLNAVLGIARLLGGTSLTTAQRESVDMILASGQSLLRILNDILDFSKVEAGRMDLSALRFDLDDVIAPVVAIMVAGVGERPLQLAIGIDPAVPHALFGDPLRLQQVLVNLLGNAIKFTPRGQVALLVEVARDGGKDDGNDNTITLDLVVTDTGIGIDSEQQTRLFAPFGQADASITRQFGGTGLGLAISRKIVDLMGGAITITSALGQGSQFRVRIPMTLPADSPRGGGDRLRGRRLLVVDQDATRRDYLARTIRAWGGQADCMATVAQARVRRAAQPPTEQPYDALLAAADALDADTLAGARVAVKRPIADLPMLLMCTPARRELYARNNSDRRTVILGQPLLGPKLADVLNALDATSATPAALAPVPVPVAPQRPLQGIHLLLVEDNDLNQIVAKGTLEMLGATLDVVDDGQQAVDRLRTRARDHQLVLMDIQMPVMDGLTATTILRKELGLTLPVIAMTAGVLESEQQECRLAGMNGVIAKPIDVDHMSHTILAQLNRRPTC